MEKIAIGYSALVEQYDLKIIPHYRASYVRMQGQGQVRAKEDHLEIHIYPKSYALKNPSDPFAQLEFALKHDGLNLEIIKAFFTVIEKKQITNYVQKHPTSKYSRIVWFLYEFLTQNTLPIKDVKKVQYVHLLHPGLYFTSKPIKSARHGVFNNLLGNAEFCPVVRRTSVLEKYIVKHFDEKVKSLIAKYDPKIIARASHYLYIKETKSSYEIERENPSPDRMKRFISILQKSSTLGVLTKENLIELQNIIVDPRFKDVDYRYTQNYVGENIDYYSQKLHYISPKPEDVPELMQGLLEALNALLENKVHPIIVAAAIAFGFVFIHPFEDGNGRIHRFLIHYVLSQSGFTPDGMIFPVSAVMLKNLKAYDNILEVFSKLLLNLIKSYDLSTEGILKVNQETKNFYQYVDYTAYAEYLFACIEETLNAYFKKELEFLVNYDKARMAMQEIVDMPNNLIDLFIRFVRQNNGMLGKNKRDQYFSKLTDEEIEAMTKIVRLYLLQDEDK